MPAEEENFANNPFKSLDANSYPDRPIQEGPDRADISDAQLFLEAVNSIHKHNKKVDSQTSEQPRAFLLADICDLPTMSIKSGNKKSPHPKARQIAEKKPDPSENDAFLWAMRNTSPLKGKGREIAPAAKVKDGPFPSEPLFEEIMAQNFEFTLSFSDEYLEGWVRGLDEQIMNRLREGQLSPEAHLDLHGLNANQAFESLREFMRSAWFKGMRVVLLVPGRGHNSPAGYGVLRQKLQVWLTQDPFKRVVLGFCTAKPYDGGPGSIYVLLRKYRKKGRIHWDKWSADADLY